MKTTTGRVLGAMNIAAALIAALVLLISLRVFWVHLQDLYFINFVTGAWLAQVNEALHGYAYPELFDGERVGGTRFMIIPIALQALVAWVLDAFGMARPEALIVSGRLMSLAATVALLYVTYLVGRRFGVPYGFALLTATVVLLTTPGQLAIHSIRYDAPSVAIQLGALLWATSKRPRWFWIGALLGVGVFCKSNAVWAGLGLTAWLVFTDRRALGQLYLGGVSCVAPIALAAHVWTGGRVWENIIGLTFGGEDNTNRGLAGSVQAIADYWIRFAKLSALLLPLSLIGWVYLSRRLPEGIPFFLAACWALLIALYSYNDIGVSYNHLLDLLVFVSVGVAAALGWACRQRFSVHIMAFGFVACAMLAAIITGHMTEEALDPGHAKDDLSDEMRAVVESIPATDPRPIFAGNSFIPIMAGERPYLMDSFMLHRIAERDPEVMESVVAQMEAQAFRAVVVSPSWLESPRVNQSLKHAINAGYRPLDTSLPNIVMLPFNASDDEDSVDDVNSKQ